MDGEKMPEGYEIPIHRSMVEARLWMGVPRKMFIVEILSAIAGGVFMKTWTVLFVAVGIHYLNRYLTQKDPRFLEVYVRSLHHRKYYYKG